MPICRIGTSSSSHKLTLFSDAMKLAFCTDDLSDQCATPDPTAYRVHIHMDKAKVGLKPRS